MSAGKHLLTVLAACLLALPLTVRAQQVAGAWARATVAGQTASAAYLELRASADATLVGVTSPFAGIAEVHEMSMDNGVMKMRARPRLDLPAGKTVALREGSYHIMLMELRRPLRKGDVLPLTLKIEGRDGRISLLEVPVEVRDLAGAPAMGHHMH